MYIGMHEYEAVRQDLQAALLLDPTHKDAEQMLQGLPPPPPRSVSVHHDTDNMEEKQEGTDNMEEEEQEDSKNTSSNRTKNYKDILHDLRRSPDYIILDFGKYKDTVIQEVPFSYMIFLAGYKMRENGTRMILCPTGAYKWVKDNRPQVRRFAAEYLKNKCWYCKGKLVPVGSSRSYDADHDDWSTRHLHKKCWKLLKNDQERFSAEND
jgi:hypothetical protein